MATGFVIRSGASYASLSNGGLTLTVTPTGTGPTAGYDINAKLPAKAGTKHILSATINSLSTSYGFSFTLGPSGAYNTGTGNQIIVNANGQIYSGGSYTGITVGTFQAGDVVYYAIDFANSRFWIKRNSGFWNNSSTADPATNTGGVSFVATGWVWARIAFDIVNFSNATGNVVITANFGASSFSPLDVPAGFIGCDVKQSILTSGSTYSVPTDWTNANYIECIGAGSNGGSGTGTGTPSSGLGGGGGAAALKVGVTGLTPGGTASYQIGVANGAATGTGATWFGSSATVLAAGAGTTTTAGGTVANSVGDHRFPGGTGAAAGTTGGGAGGAAGFGRTYNGAATLFYNDTTIAGGNASGQTGGAANSSTTNGGGVDQAGISSVLEYGTAGSGSGAGGRSTNGVGLAGGNYGGGGGGGRRSGNVGGTAGGGLIVVNWFYTPPAPPAVEPIYRGVSWTNLYEGVRTDAQIYRGAKILR